MCDKIYRDWNNKYCHQITWNVKITAENVKKVYITQHMKLKARMDKLEED